MSRTCGDCTKCCEGFLQATIRGFKVGEVVNDDWHNPKPCPFVVKDKGCKQYLLRPKDPCKSFKCEWLVNEEMPEEMKPNISKSITVAKRTPKGIPYLSLLDAGEQLDSRVLSWHILYAIKNSLNISWRINGKVEAIGHPNFMNEIHGHS